MSDAKIALVILLIGLVIAKFIGIFPTIILMMIFFITVLVFAYFDRKRDPEKWDKIDKEQKEKAKEKAKVREEKEKIMMAEMFWTQYQKATKSIPKSEWILMSREEKSVVFAEREGVKTMFYAMPLKTREFIKNKYKIDISFKGF